MATQVVSVSEKPSETKFSIRYLMLIVTAVATGLAVGRLSIFEYRQGFEATAAVFVVAHLLSEIKLVKKSVSLDSSTRRFHLLWRGMLLCAIASFFVLEFAGLVLERERFSWLSRFIFGSMFIGKLSPLELVLQLAFLSYLMLGLRPAPKLRWSLILLAVVLAGLFAVYAYGDIVLLVQIAIEAMEVSSTGVQYGEISQYATDSGTMYADVEVDLQLRRDRFLWASVVGGIAFLIASVYSLVVFSRKPKSSHRVRNQFLKLIPGIVLAAAYPCWVYGAGLGDLCPPFADAGLSSGILALTCGLVAVALVATLMAYRCREPEQAEPQLPESSFTTLIALVFSCLATLGFLEISTWTSTWMFSLETLPYWLVSFNVTVAWATLILLIPKIYQLVFQENRPTRVVGRIEPARMRLIFFALVAVFALGAQNIWWLSYALRMWSMQS